MDQVQEMQWNSNGNQLVCAATPFRRRYVTTGDSYIFNCCYDRGRPNNYYVPSLLSLLVVTVQRRFCLDHRVPVYAPPCGTNEGFLCRNMSSTPGPRFLRNLQLCMAGMYMYIIWKPNIPPSKL